MQERNERATSEVMPHLFYEAIPIAVVVFL